MIAFKRFPWACSAHVTFAWAEKWGLYPQACEEHLVELAAGECAEGSRPVNGSEAEAINALSFHVSGPTFGKSSLD